MDRSEIISGDLLIWEHSKRSAISDFYLNIIRILTKSLYAHVGVAIRLEGRLYVIEATQPVVRITPIRNGDEFYHLPMGIKWSKESEDYLISKVGARYSFADAVRAFLGKTLQNDNRYQCAELCNEFYSMHSYSLKDAFTPTTLVEKLMEQYGKKISFSKSF